MKHSRKSIIVLILIAVTVVFSVKIVANTIDRGKISSNSNVRNDLKVKNFDAYNGINSSNIQTVGSEADVNWNINDPSYFYKNSRIVAKIKIESIDGARNINLKTKEPIRARTLGSFTVLDIYKGDIKKGEKLLYSRLGAIMKFEEYIKGTERQAAEKIMNLRRKERIQKEYIKDVFIGDIDVEVGKTYLAYLDVDNTDNVVRYSILWMQYGLREIKTENGQDLILNNETKKLEKMDMILGK